MFEKDASAVNQEKEIRDKWMGSEELKTLVIKMITKLENSKNSFFINNQVKYENQVAIYNSSNKIKNRNELDKVLRPIQKQ